MITEEIRTKVEEMAVVFVMGDTADFRSVAELHVRLREIERLAAVQTELALARISEEAAEIVEQLFLRPDSDPQTDFEVLLYSVQTLLELAHAAGDPKPVTSRDRR